jgi:hypothetical protein
VIWPWKSRVGACVISRMATRRPLLSTWTFCELGNGLVTLRRIFDLAGLRLAAGFFAGASFEFSRAQHLPPPA